MVMIWFWVPRDPVRKNGSIDIGAAVLSAVALGSLGWSLTEASNRAGLSPTVAAGFALCMVALILLVRLERRRGDNAMLPPSLSGSRTLAGINLYTALLYGCICRSVDNDPLHDDSRLRHARECCRDSVHTPSDPDGCHFTSRAGGMCPHRASRSVSNRGRHHGSRMRLHAADYAWNGLLDGLFSSDPADVHRNELRGCTADDPGSDFGRRRICRHRFGLQRRHFQSRLTGSDRPAWGASERCRRSLNNAHACGDVMLRHGLPRLCRGYPTPCSGSIRSVTGRCHHLMACE